MLTILTDDASSIKAANSISVPRGRSAFYLPPRTKNSSDFDSCNNVVQVFANDLFRSRAIITVSAQRRRRAGVGDYETADGGTQFRSLDTCR